MLGKSKNPIRYLLPTDNGVFQQYLPIAAIAKSVATFASEGKAAVHGAG
jgi:hypothetical protein